MEQHGSNNKINVIAVIPARYASTRLAGKLLLEIDGKPLILHTLAQVKMASNVSWVIVATDNSRIFDVVTKSGNEAIMTSSDHESGSDRIAEVAEAFPHGSIVVNVQGDEPLIAPSTIEQAVAAILSDATVDIATASERFTDFRDVVNANVVKVVTDSNGRALYFSRSPIPFPREAVQRHGDIETALTNEPDLLMGFRKHVGIYAYRREFLLSFTKMQQSNLEKSEMLEQLRALESGARIQVVKVDETSIGVDTQDDFQRAKTSIENARQA